MKHLTRDLLAIIRDCCLTAVFSKRLALNRIEGCLGLGHCSVPDFYLCALPLPAFSLDALSTNLWKLTDLTGFPGCRLGFSMLDTPRLVERDTLQFPTRLTQAARLEWDSIALRTEQVAIKPRLRDSSTPRDVLWSTPTVHAKQTADWPPLFGWQGPLPPTAVPRPKDLVA